MSAKGFCARFTATAISAATSWPSLLREDWQQSPLAAVRVQVRGTVPEAFICAERQ